MTEASSKTLRLLMPQWQGGTLPAYHFGAQMLNFLAPVTTGETITVPVAAPSGDDLPVEDGIVARTALLQQADAAATILSEQSPDRIVVLGGDCLVDLAPFAYLSERHGDDLAILWVDSHPDILTPDHFSHAHAMVLGNLLGKGDNDFSSRVKHPVKPQNVMYAGLYDMMPLEWNFVRGNGMAMATPAELADSSEKVLDWFRSTGASRLAIHLDLDVLDPKFFRSLYFSNPLDAPGAFGATPEGRMTMDQVTRLLNDVAAVADIVGLGIAEHLPWDAIALKNMLESLPLIGQTA
ncbi:arginase family protein [Martelella alba]|uniref:Arginase family protein n=1 Tax=Martelella alba TaxID=2590451 RepID=A0A506U4G2_9HYPH|nr:arginase family protein [Martelella alba]TPW26767.1 arginase family protein [Martelella alba]